MINIAICGYGYWGPNLFRNFAANPLFSIVAAADQNRQRREAIQETYPSVQVFDDAVAAIHAPDIDAVAIVTPAGTHFKLAKAALEAGKHVLLEKPMCTTADEADELVAIARRNGLVLMIDHIFIMAPPVQFIKQKVDDGAFGKITYYDALRVNLGLFHNDVNVLWDLAPHDLAVLYHLLDEDPVHVEATGYCHTSSGLPDIVYATLHYPSQVIAHLNLSWMSPTKVRRVAVGGTGQMLVWDDLNREEPIRVYDAGIQAQPTEKRNELLIGYRLGEVVTPRLPVSEPLANVVQHFGDVIAGKAVSQLDGELGARVVRTLERLQQSLDRSLATVRQHQAPAKALKIGS